MALVSWLLFQLFFVINISFSFSTKYQLLECWCSDNPISN